MSAIEFQRRILEDSVRNDAFARAIKMTLKPGDTVIDLGAGTGFLSMLACKFGAGQCFCIEQNPDMAKLLREMLRVNNVKNCTVIEAHSKEVRGLPKADLVISETLGNFAYEEGIIETLRDAQRFLKLGGVMIPSSLSQHAAPMIQERLWKELAESWNGIGFDLLWEPALRRTMNNCYVKTGKPEELLTRSSWDAVDFRAKKNASIRTGTLEWKMVKPETIFGLLLWFECTLAPGIILSTSPFAKKTHWEQIFLPALEPLVFEAEETLRTTITSDSRPAVKINLTWVFERISKDGKTVLAQEKMDMKKGW